MKKILTYLSLLFLLTCAKEDSQNPNTPPSDLTKQYNLTVSSGEGGSVSTAGGTFPSGAQVNITATPSEGYSFSGWSNGSTDNPISVILNSNTSITANFQVIVNSYTLTVSVEEGGSVSTVGGEYEEGVEVTITAIADQGYEFIGWSNGSTEQSITLVVSSDTEITANFNSITYDFFDSLSDINKKTSWYQTNYNFIRFHPDMNIPFGNCFTENESITVNCDGSNDEWGKENGGYIYYDFFNDGQPDLWHTFHKSPWPQNDNSRDFFINDFSVNNQEIDSMYVSLHQIRKQVLTDLNNDNFKEIVLFSHGYDAPPFPGDSLGIFIPTLRKNIYLDEVIGFFHGGATGDLNNDGLEDIYSSRYYNGRPTVYINQGDYNFTYDPSLFTGIKECCYVTDELLDLNNDNKIDIVSDKQVVFQDESGQFNFDLAWDLPIENIYTPLDIDFFDFNNDNKIDLIVSSEKNFYEGARLDILIQSDDGFINKTQDYLDFYEFDGSNTWWKWLYVIDFDNDGDLDLLADGLFGEYFNYNQKTLWWENIDGTFRMSLGY